MELTALIAYLLFMAIAFGLKTVVQLRRTGESGFRGISGRPGSPEWLAGVSFVAAVLIGLAAPVLALLDVAEAIDLLDSDGLHAAGFLLFFTGLAGTVAAQSEMGSAWRVGVDERERTTLVTGGPFALVRNPFFAATLPAALGIALMLPSWPAIAGFVALLFAVELQVRVVEEPYLLRAHGDDYRAYASRTGRFVPGVGRL